MESKVAELCSVCGLEPATYVNDEYDGCVPYAMGDNCYIRKFGVILESDFEPGQKPPCTQCGEPAFKMDRDNPYCLRHYRDRVEPPVNPIREHFKEGFGISSEAFFSENFEIVKDKFDMEG